MPRHSCRFYLVAIVLLYPAASRAGAYPLPQHEIKFFTEFAWSRSNGIFAAQDNQVRLSRAICADAQSRKLDYCGHTYEKREGKLFVEYGALRYLTMIGEIAGGRQRSFQRHAERDWLELSAGFRLVPYQRRFAVAIENSYGYAYQRESVNIGQKKEAHGGFMKIALMLGFDWQLHRYIRNYITNGYGWKHNLEHQIEADYFFTTATLGIELSKTWLRYHVIILSDLWIKADSSGAHRYRSLEYSSQISAVMFPIDQLGVQLGYRTIFGGRNIEMSDGIFTKLWLTF